MRDRISSNLKSDASSTSALVKHSARTTSLPSELESLQTRLRNMLCCPVMECVQHALEGTLTVEEVQWANRQDPRAKDIAQQYNEETGYMTTFLTPVRVLYSRCLWSPGLTRFLGISASDPSSSEPGISSLPRAGLSVVLRFSGGIYF